MKEIETSRNVRYNIACCWMRTENRLIAVMLFTLTQPLTLPLGKVNFPGLPLELTRGLTAIFSWCMPPIHLRAKCESNPRFRLVHMNAG